MDMNSDLRKPRRLKGTLSYKVRNYVALGVISVGAVVAVIFHFTRPGNFLKKQIEEGKFNTSEEEIDRKLLMKRIQPFSPRTASQIAETLEKKNDDLFWK